jgi:uncharacterized protein (DUF488 family)
MMTLYTIGHGHTSVERFLELLRLHQIEALFDTRSQPYSRFAPQFNRESLKASLQHAGTVYLYLGDQLGGRSRDPVYKLPNGKVDSERLAGAPAFLEGLRQLKRDAEKRRVAIMCSEADYRKCHRFWLITRALVGDGVDVQHILHSGELAHTSPDAFAAAVDQLCLF